VERDTAWTHLGDRRFKLRNRVLLWTCRRHSDGAVMAQMALRGDPSRDRVAFVSLQWHWEQTSLHW